MTDQKSLEALAEKVNDGTAEAIKENIMLRRINNSLRMQRDYLIGKLGWRKARFLRAELNGHIDNPFAMVEAKRAVPDRWKLLPNWTDDKGYPFKGDWTPSGREYDKSIHHNPDAKAWADLFVSTFPGLADKRDIMHGWFANSMMAMHDHIKSKQPLTPAPKSQSGANNRTPKDYAIEHAGYLATSAKNFLDVVNQTLTEDTDLGDARDKFSDAFSDLRSMIYEFEKRAERAIAEGGK